MLFIHSESKTFFLFDIAIMNSLNFDNHSKSLAFKKLKHLLHKYYFMFPKICKSCEHFHQFVVLIYDSTSNLSQFLGIGKLLKNSNVLQIGMGKNPTTSFIVKSQNVEIFLMKQKL